MKFFSVAATVSLFITGAFSLLEIGAPPNGTQVQPNQNVTVMAITPVPPHIISIVFSLADYLST
jgi:hypothetical protein